MTRKITEEAVRAFYMVRDFNKSNTRVEVENVSRIGEGQPEKFTRVAMYLHGNCIARFNHDGTRRVEITDAGWRTNTTKERLNGLDGVSISQKKGVWYLNGKALGNECYEPRGYGSRLKWTDIGNY